MDHPKLSAAIMCAAALSFFGPGALGDECPHRTILATKPSLTGRIENQASNLGLAWRSAAGSDRSTGWWTIDDSVCNVGQGSLIIDWPKAELSNDAYTALSPGREMYNQFSVGPNEPLAGDAQLKYGGYVSSQAQTQIYQAPVKSQKTGQAMHSALGGAIFSGETFADFPPKDRSVSFEVSITVEKYGEGYMFVAYVKGASPKKFRIALSSSQNELFAQALKEAKIPASGIAPLEKIAHFSKNSGALERLGGKPFVFMPVSGTPLKLLIHSKTSEIEIAKVVLITDTFEPALVGKVSLFR